VRESDSGVNTHDELEDVLNAHQQVFAVVDLNVELVLNCIVDHHACTYVEVIVFVIPVCLKCDWYTIPAVGVDVPESFATDFDDALGKHMRLLVQMDVVLPRVIKTSERNRQEHLAAHEH